MSIATRAALIALSIASSGCPGDDDLVDDVGTTGEASSTADDGAPPMTGAADGSSTNAADADSTTGDTTDSDSDATDDTDGDTTDATSSSVCGDDTIEADEACDGTDLGGQDCTGEGFDGGKLACADDCTFDARGCFTRTCHNNLVEGTEGCDGEDLAGEDCVSQGFDAGTLACAAGCAAFDTGACITYVCGDEMAEGDEVCDGADLGGEDCISQGFSAGTLACAADCSGLDTSGCSDAPACIEQNIGTMTGPAVSTGSTALEDEDLSQTCGFGGSVDRVIYWVAPEAGVFTLQAASAPPAFYPSAIAVYSDCNAMNEVGCSDVSSDGLAEVTVIAEALQPFVVSVNGLADASGEYVLNITETALTGPCCAANETPGCEDAACSETVCAANGTCCANDWDSTCSALAAAMCTACTTPNVCGNGTIDGMGEACDGDDYGGETCVSQGFDFGELSCADDCSALDVSECGSYSGDCCGVDFTPGCDDSSCNADVCDALPFCCDSAWVPACAELAAELCGVCEVCGDDVAVQSEVCDGSDLLAESCSTQGFVGGPLACESDCSALDTSACVANGGGDCCAGNGSPGCDDDTCVAAVCDSSPECCDTAWTQACADAAALSCTTCGAAPPLSNGSFETTDFTAWTTQDVGEAFSPLQVRPAGPGLFFAFFDLAPTNGAFAAVHGWDGDGATGPSDEIVIAQTHTVSATASTAALTFDYRLAWSLTFGATVDREFLVRIADDMGNELDSIVIETATAGTMNGDTGDQAGSIDLTPYLGQTINVAFVWTVPEDMGGPGQALLDNVVVGYT